MKALEYQKGIRDVQNQSCVLDILDDEHREVAEGLLYTHTRINDSTKKTLEAASFLYALIELLNEKGLVLIEELDERKKAGIREACKEVRRKRHRIAVSRFGGG